MSCQASCQASKLSAKQGRAPRAEEDRRQRRRKLGLPEELGEEERAAEAARAADKDKAKAAASFVPVKPVTLLSNLRELLVRPHPCFPSWPRWCTNKRVVCGVLESCVLTRRWA